MATLDEKIAEAERDVSRYESDFKDSDRALKGARAQLNLLIAEKAREAAMTVGERMAKAVVSMRGCAAYEESFWVGRNPVDGLFLVAPDLAMTQGVGQLRDEFAAAIDKAVTDEREACANLCTRAADGYSRSSRDDSEAASMACRARAHEIMDRT